MNRLSSQQVLMDNNTDDPTSITNLKLTHKALSDVSCLGEFKNLERLDLSFNSLTSLEGLKSCVNLKWLSVVQNKLKSLKGIEGLSKVTVLNAGKNQLKSMEEVKCLVNLRALILNDNEIVSICRLDELKDLNTLVLSRNPVRKIGESLVKIKSLTKLSLSNCQLQTIGSSLKSCLELKELRLAHNDIKVLPPELAVNIKLQNLDLGNNIITSWSDLKMLSSLVNLKNLNLQGNPIAEKSKLARKIQKALPGLQIFNARPLEKILKDEKNDEVDGAEKSPFIAADMLGIQENDSNHISGKMPHLARVLVGDKGRRKDKIKETEDQVDLEDNAKSKNKHKRKTDSQQGQKEECEYDEDERKKKKQKRHDKQMVKENSMRRGEERTVKLNEDKKKSKQGELEIIDDGDTSFAELFTVDTVKVPRYVSESNGDNKAVRELDSASGLFTYPNKKKKNRSSSRRSSGIEMISTTLEVGMGGPSAWDDA